jgi:hypothetical protein
MNFSIGLYDLFSYLLPGVLNLYILNEFLILFNWASIDINKLANAIYIAIALIVAYIIGQLTSALAQIVWYGHYKRYSGIQERALRKLQGRCEGVVIHYRPKEWAVLLEILRRRDKSSTDVAERFKVDSMMMRNLNVSLLFFALLQVGVMIKGGIAVQPIVQAALLIALALLAYTWGKRYDEWYYRAIYTQALSYGPGLKEFLANDQPKWQPPVEAKDPYTEEYQ